MPLLYCSDYCSFGLYFKVRELFSFFSSSIFWNSLRRICIISSLYAQWSSLVKLSSPGVCLLGVFVWFGLGVLFACLLLIADSFSLLVIYSEYLFLWFIFERFYVSRNVLISSVLSNLLAYSCSILFWFFKISLPYQLLFLLLYFLFYLDLLSFFLMSLSKDLSILPFRKTSSWCHWSAALYFGFLFYFLSDLYYFLPSADFRLCLFFFSNSFR